MSLTIVSAFTSGPRGGGYEQFVDPWLASVRKWCPKANICLFNLGEIETWREAAHMKPSAIASAMEAYPLSVLWVDIDAELRGPLDYFTNWQGGNIGLRRRKDEHDGYVHHMTGTFYLDNDDLSREFVRRWAWDSLSSSEPRNQAVVERILGKHVESGLTVTDIPPAYCWIDEERDRKRHPDVEPVIVHYMHQKKQRALGRV